MLADALGAQPVLARERLFDGRVWDVEAQEFELGGTRIRREVVVHPGAVAIAAVNERDELMLVHQYRHPAGGTLWELPAGLLDVDGEDPLDAALRALREGKVQLPPLSPLWERVEALRADRHTRLEDVVKFVSEEPALAARLLQVTNSSQLGGRRPVTNLRAACLRAGNDAVLEAARVVLLESSFDLASGPHAETGRLLWRHVVTCSRICGQLAPFARLDPATASLAGLLHNVGELVIFAALADVPGLRFDPPAGPLRAFLRAHHEAVGARLLDGWGMPSAIVAVARHHHAPPRSPETDGARRLRAIVHAGWVGAFDAAGDYLGWTADEQSPPDLAALGVPGPAWTDALDAVRVQADG